MLGLFVWARVLPSVVLGVVLLLSLLIFIVMLYPRTLLRHLGLSLVLRRPVLPTGVVDRIALVDHVFPGLFGSCWRVCEGDRPWVSG
jgi:hypothetical protein